MAGSDFGVAFGAATGATLQAIVGTWLVHHFVGSSTNLEVTDWQDVSTLYGIDQARAISAATVSDALGTQLTSIKGSLVLLKRCVLGDLSEGVIAMLIICYQNVERL